MITRRHFHRALVWIGLATGALGAGLYILSLFVSIYHDGGDQMLYLGRGAIVSQWGIQRGGTIVPTPTGNVVKPPPPPAGWGAERPGSRPWRWIPHWIEANQGYPGLIAVPYWVLVLIGLIALHAALPPGAALRDTRCPRCRFDLSTSPSVEVHRVHVLCPECGTLSERDESSHEKPPARAGGS